MQSVKGIAVPNADANSSLPRVATGLSHAAANPWNKRSKNSRQVSVFNYQVHPSSQN